MKTASNEESSNIGMAQTLVIFVVAWATYVHQWPNHVGAWLVMTTALAAAGAKPDQIEISAWDPTMVVVDAFRKLGTDASAAQLRTYLLNLKGWVGVNGPYDFHAFPQRGIGTSAVTIARWDAAKDAWINVSRPGGVPLK